MIQPWPDYATVWRWHFYAGVFCIPFVLVLSVSGTIFLFRPQIEAWQDRRFDQLESRDQQSSYAEQVVSACEASKGWFASIEIRSEPPTQAGCRSATRVIVERGGERIRVYVDPMTGAVLGQVSENDRLIPFIRRLHGELLLGKRGSYLVELAASWTVLMIVTGIVLWMPMDLRIAGIIYPRVTRKGKVFWRDLHSVVGFWSAGLILLLIATGLPWSTFWGDYFKAWRQLTGTSVLKQDWEGGHGNTTLKGHHSKQQSWRAKAPDPAEYRLVELGTVADFAKTLSWLPPVTVQPPGDGTSVWKIQSETANRPMRKSIQYDALTRMVVSQESFQDKHWLDRWVGQGIALHEGQRFVGTRFGWLNQAFALFATLSLVVLSCSGGVLWWRRRRKPHSGGGRVVWNQGLCPPATRPPATASKLTGQTITPTRSALVILIGLALGIYLPLFGISAVAVIVADRFAVPLFPRVGRWLGRC